MIRAFRLEWLKLKHYRAFWVLYGMYLLALVLIASIGMILLEWLKAQGADFDGIDPTMLPIYDFPDIWQNTTYLAAFARVLLGFIVIISVSNDLTYNTLRQNVIDGISKKEYLLSKLSLIVFLAATSTLTLFAASMVNGLIYSNVMSLDVVFDEMEFLIAYFLDIFIYCTLAFLLTLIIKKSGFVIVGLFLYTLMFEPIASVILENVPYLRDTLWQQLPAFFPVHALNDLIPVPFPKYIFREIVDNIPIKALLVSFSWLGIYLYFINFILVRRDLK